MGTAETTEIRESHEPSEQTCRTHALDQIWQAVRREVDKGIRVEKKASMLIDMTVVVIIREVVVGVLIPCKAVFKSSKIESTMCPSDASLRSSGTRASISQAAMTEKCAGLFVRIFRYFKKKSRISPPSNSSASSRADILLQRALRLKPAGKGQECFAVVAWPHRSL